MGATILIIISGVGWGGGGSVIGDLFAEKTPEYNLYFNQHAGNIFSFFHFAYFFMYKEWSHLFLLKLLFLHL